MADEFNTFTIDTTPDGDIFIVGYDTAVPGGERRIQIKNLFAGSEIGIPGGLVKYSSLTGDVATILSISTTGRNNTIPIDPPSALGSLSVDFDNGGANNGRLRYTGAITRRFMVDAVVSFSNGSNVSLTLMLAKNGVVDAAAPFQTRKMGGASDVGVASVSDEIELSTNDYVEVFVGNLDSTGAVTTFGFTLRAHH